MTDNSKIQKICQRIYKDFTTGKRIGTLGDFIATLDDELKVLSCGMKYLMKKKKFFKHTENI